MKPFILPTVFFCCVFAVHVRGAPPPSSSADSGIGTAPIKVNLTVPLVETPKTVLEFAANPTSQELFQAHVFEEPLVPIDGEPDVIENVALAAALLDYSKRSGPDDFSSLTMFLEKYPLSPWRAALLTDLGLEYYRTARYSLALEAWQRAWELGEKATDAKGKFLADRAVCELAGLYSRLGRMKELDALLKSVEHRVLVGGATERINIAREALAYMRFQPGVAFRCGPLALLSIKHSLNQDEGGDQAIVDSASTQNGFSLTQVAELSKTIGLNSQMAFRTTGGEFVVPSVIHWKAGHYAAILREENGRYLVQDPTFGTKVWATRAALETESSGYFLVPPGKLPEGWRPVEAEEGGSVWGRGVVNGNDPDRYACTDTQTAGCTSGGCQGMAVSTVHLMLANLQVKDMPVGYLPPVGPPVGFTVRYNHRDYVQPPSQTGKVLGSKWTHDWYATLQDDTNNPMSDVKYFVGGGGVRTFTGFDTNTQTFAAQQFDHTLLGRIGPNIATSSYEMVFPDGSKRVYGARNGFGQIALTQVIDKSGNTLNLTWDASGQIFRLLSLTDAIGQVTTISYEHPTQSGLITKVTDPFGRFATFDYSTVQIAITNSTNVITVYLLSKITDVLGLQSRFEYLPQSDIMFRMITPYGTNSFTTGQGGGPSGTTRFVETTYPDGSRDRVEFNQSNNLGIPAGDPASSLPTGGIACYNDYLYARNTFYWSRTACATSYGDYTKAKIYHWLHTPDLTSSAGTVESMKSALEGRIWYDYPGQTSGSQIAGSNDTPVHIGRVLDDGSTQLYTYGYNSFGHLTNSIDPVGRKLSFIYATNNIDLLQVRQTRGTNNELLAQMTYNSQHLPLSVVDAAGQTNYFSYNSRGQRVSHLNPKGETTSYTYDANGYVVAIDGPLAGTNDTVTATYDGFGRIRTTTDVDGYTLTSDYDAMNRLTQITYPDASFEHFTYDRLDLTGVKDRAGRHTLLEYDSMRQVKKRTDPLGRVTLFDWCRCGALQSLTDPLGRTTSWQSDVQGRRTSKQYADGSQIRFVYENVGGRLKQVIDEKQQFTQFDYNRDNTIKSIAYLNSVVPTPNISFNYDQNYVRVVSMSDGAGTTAYGYNQITSLPNLGAGQLGSVDGPLANDTTTYVYDVLGRQVHRAVGGADSSLTYDAVGRITGTSNLLGSFIYAYDGSSRRILSGNFPNGQTVTLGYGGNLQDRKLQRVTYQAGVTPISEFLYGHDAAANRILTWSQQAGAQPASVYAFGYDAADQLISGAVTNAGMQINAFAYAYDPAGNRLTESTGSTTNTATYNSLNQNSTTTASVASRTNEWDAVGRLAAVVTGNRRVEFAYNGFDHLTSIRLLTNGVQASFRRFIWSGNTLCEERDAAGSLVKRYFGQGMTMESGTNAGIYFYTRDHLGSVRELTDGTGAVRARYVYDPYGRRTKVNGDVDADFGFAGMFWSPEANLALTHFRAYDPELGRWLSRDPLRDAELKEGPNLYAYVRNQPISRIDPSGLALTTVDAWCEQHPVECAQLGGAVTWAARAINKAEDILPSVPDAVPCMETRIGFAAGWAPNITPSIQTLVGYAGGPGGEAGGEIEAAFANTSPAVNIPPALANTIPSLTGQVPPILSDWDRKLKAAQWLVTTLDSDSMRKYRDGLYAVDPEADARLVKGLDQLSQMLYGL